MRAFVTGATGLVGSSLCRALLSKGYAVTALVRSHSDLSPLDALPVERFTGDILEPNTLYEGMSGCDYVFHAASIFAYADVTQDELDRTAVTGTENVLVAAKAALVRRVVLTSSSVVFGSSPMPELRDETAGLENEPFISPYALSKARQASAANRLAAELDIDLVSVNPTITVGPFDTRLGPSNAIVLIYWCDPFRATFPGGITIAGSDDVAEGHILAAERGARGESYILGGEALEWRDVHAAIAGLSGLPGPLFSASATATFLSAAVQEAWSRWNGMNPMITRDQARMIGRYYWYSHRKAAALGYRPRSARESLAAAIAWLARSPHVRPEIRRSFVLAPEVRKAQADLRALARRAS